MTDGAPCSSRSACITGIGLVTPLGNDRETSWQGYCSGRSGVGPVRGWDASAELVQIGAQLAPDWEACFEREVRLPFARRYSRFTRMGLHATQQALAQAGLLPEQRAGLNSERAGISFGVGGGPTHYLSPMRDALATGEVDAYMRGIDHTFVLQTMFNAPAGLGAIQFDLRGPSGIVSAACASGAGAIAQGLDWLRSGRADWVVVGGCDSTVDRETLHAYQRVGALTVDNDRGSSASRPFDRSRSGFVMGEGAAALILETEAHAQARGARPLARLLGAGLVTEAHKIASPQLDGSGMARAMRACLHDARLAPEQVEHISAHAPSTVQGDLAEARALHACFGAHAARLSVTAPKSMTGHAIGGSSAISAALAAMSLAEGKQTPTLHLQELDPEIDLDVVTELREHQGGAILLNAFGFGGHNISLVLGATAST
jgi:3-oxoacyl-[acyl-carrier-protein] synthase II